MQTNLFLDVEQDDVYDGAFYAMDPEILFLDLVFLHGEPNDAYLDFPGYLGELFTPGGKTIKIPGFRDFLERVYVRESL